MKLFLFILLLLPITGFSSEADLPKTEVISEESISDHNFNFKVNVLGIAFGLGDVSLEYKLNPNFTITGSLLFGQFTQKSNNKTYEFDIKTFGGNVKGTYYFSKTFKDSFYLSASAGTLDVDVKLKNSNIPVSSDFSSAYIGANLGYAWHWKHLNIGIGAGYNHSFEDDEAKIKIDNIVGTTTVQVHYNLILEAALGVTF